MTHIIKTLKDFGLCDEVHYKEKYLPQREVEGRPRRSTSSMTMAATEFTDAASDRSPQLGAKGAA